MKKNALLIYIVTALCCAAMAAIDGILQPGYVVKSCIKIVLFLFIPVIFSAARKLSVLEYFRPDKKALLTGGCLGLATFSVILTAYALLHSYIDLSAVPQSLEQSAGVTKSNFLLVSTYIALCNSLLEEFFFRGFAFFTLKPLAGRGFAYGFSALVFSVYHTAMMLGWWEWWLFALALAGLFAGGLLFDYLNERTGTIWCSWMVHMCANFAINTVGCLLFGIL